MKLSRVYIIIGISLLLASCGKQYDAEKTVEAFVDQYAENAGALKGIDFADIGTTRHISDSLIQVMRHRGAPLFKKGITYGQVPEGELYYLNSKPDRFIFNIFLQFITSLLLRRVNHRIRALPRES